MPRVAVGEGQSQDLNAGHLTTEPLVLTIRSHSALLYPLQVSLAQFSNFIRCLSSSSQVNLCISVFLPFDISSFLLKIPPLFNQFSGKPSTVYFTHLLVSFFGIFTWLISTALRYSLFFEENSSVPFYIFSMKSF